jgi:N-methylhydantoinase A/oxoprolinase/acetone carboxylase beta subunit
MYSAFRGQGAPRSEGTSPHPDPLPGGEGTSSRPGSGGAGGSQPREWRVVGLEEGRPTRCAVYGREALAVGEMIEGPAVVEEAASTLLLYAGDRLRVADGGHLIVEVGSS